MPIPGHLDPFLLASPGSKQSLRQTKARSKSSELYCSRPFCANLPPPASSLAQIPSPAASVQQDHRSFPVHRSTRRIPSNGTVEHRILLIENDVELAVRSRGARAAHERMPVRPQLGPQTQVQQRFAPGCDIGPVPGVGGEAAGGRRLDYERDLASVLR